MMQMRLSPTIERSSTSLMRSSTIQSESSRNQKGTSSRRSTQWSPPTTDEEEPNQIAIYRSAIDEHSDDSTSIPPYLAADGLAQVIDQYSLRDVFENILIKPDYALDYDYAEQKQNVRAELSELREQRFQLVQTALRTLLSNIDETASPPEFDIDPDDNVESTLENMANAPKGAEDTVINAWIGEFTTAGLAEPVTRQCIAAAATEEPYARLQHIATALQNASDLYRQDLRDHQVWDELDSWPTDSDVEPLRKYLTAVAKVDAFWATYTDSESNAETAITLAVDAAANLTAPPAPLTPVIEGIPDGDRVETALRNRLLIELQNRVTGPFPSPSQRLSPSGTQPATKRSLPHSVRTMTPTSSSGRSRRRSRTPQSRSRLLLTHWTGIVRTLVAVAALRATPSDGSSPCSGCQRRIPSWMTRLTHLSH